MLNKNIATLCIREIRWLFTKMVKMRIDKKINKLIWPKGILSLTRRIKIKISRKIDSSN